MRRLREACGENVGVNFDPSHLWWQGMDPFVVAEELGRAGMLFHVHAKDTYIDQAVAARDGLLATSAPESPGRSWRFATIGYGHDVGFWRSSPACCAASGYEGVVSIEHEDPLAPIMEGLGAHRRDPPRGPLARTERIAVVADRSAGVDHDREAARRAASPLVLSPTAAFAALVLGATSISLGVIAVKQGYAGGSDPQSLNAASAARRRALRRAGVAVPAQSRPAHRRAGGALRDRRRRR